MKIVLSNYYIGIRDEPHILSLIESWLNSIDVKTVYKGRALNCYATQNTLYEILLKLSFDYDIEI